MGAKRSNRGIDPPGAGELPSVSERRLGASHRGSRGGRVTATRRRYMRVPTFMVPSASAGESNTVRRRGSSGFWEIGGEEVESDLDGFAENFGSGSRFSIRVADGILGDDGNSGGEVVDDL